MNEELHRENLSQLEGTCALVLTDLNRMVKLCEDILGSAQLEITKVNVYSYAKDSYKQKVIADLIERTHKVREGINDLYNIILEIEENQNGSDGKNDRIQV